MKQDYRYECALTAALVILERFDRSPGEPRYRLLAEAVFSILEAMERCEQERGVADVGCIAD